MHNYTYQHGDRPLDGYTIQRAVGRGGFGEVYYALSDSGREVAIKAILAHEDIELRGISQCMNLKSPHLVTIYDVKYNDEGRPFVIMEYVSGPSLGDLIHDAPAGIGEQKAAFFLREIAKGLAYLHDCGIVHRDLKPGNIFYENGYVKIGDYGLAKSMAHTAHSGQTATIGTLHYMAPEVGVGKYDKSIDVYALGVILYEMLTGQPPFLGQSHAEILMKHLQAEPDLSAVKEPFATAIRRAMAKDVTIRYQNVQEMVETVFGTEHVRHSVSHFRPESLTTIGRKVAAKVAGTGSTGGLAAKQVATLTYGGHSDRPHGWADRIEDSIGNFAERFKGRGPLGPADTPRPHPVVRDQLSAAQRWALASMATAVVAITTALLSGGEHGYAVGLTTGATAALFILGSTLGMTLARKLAPRHVDEESWPLKRLTFTLCSVFFGTLFASTLIGAFVHMPNGLGVEMPLTLAAVSIVFVLLNAARLTSPAREERLTLGSVVIAGIGGYLLAHAFDAGGVGDILAAAVAAGVALTAQIAAAFDPDYVPGAARNDSQLELDAAFDPRIGIASDKRRVAFDSTGNADQPSSPGDQPGHAPHTFTEQVEHAANRFAENVQKAADKCGIAPDLDAPPSDRNRTAALILALIPFLTGGFVCGIHRFYVGKIGTGFLWMFTFGFGFIGQIIDIVLILGGSFTDSQNRVVERWGDQPRRAASRSRSAAAQRATQARPSQPPYRQPFDPIGSVFGFLGGILAFLTTLVGLTLCLGLPDFIAAGLPAPEINQSINDFLKTPDWTAPANFLQWMSLSLLATLAGTLLALSRRRTTGLHVTRSIMGIALLILSISLFYHAFDRTVWTAIAPQIHAEEIAPAVNIVIQRINQPLAIASLVTFVLTQALLAWPAPRQPLPNPPDAQPQAEA